MSQATARVQKSLAKNLSRRGKLPAFVTALGFLAFTALQVLLTTLVSLIGYSTYDSVQANPLDYVFPGLGITLLTSTVPFAFGFFVSLWILAPISDELELRFVIARGVLAGAVGFVIVAIVGVILAFVATVEGGGTGSTLGYSWPWEQFGGFGANVLTVLATSLGLYLSYLPHVMLAAVLLWHWLRTHERSHSVSGILDEM
jgi:MFS family permease